MSEIRWRYIAFCICLLFIGCSGTAVAQKQSGTQIVKGDANSCELNSLHLDYLVQDARASSERVFVIGRLGKRETSRLLNRRRLHIARNHLVTSGRLNKDFVVFAEGDQSDKEGRLEFYLGSKLYLVSLIERGKDVCLTCCNDRFPENN